MKRIIIYILCLLPVFLEGQTESVGVDFPCTDCNLEVMIIPDENTACGAELILLRLDIKGTGNFQYKWKDENGNTHNEATWEVAKGGVYSVIVTDIDNPHCLARDEFDTGRSDDDIMSAVIKAKLEGKGFFSIPVTITSEPATLGAATARSNAPNCDDLMNQLQSCDGAGAACVYLDDEALTFDINGSPIADIQTFVTDNLLFFSELPLGYEASKAFITTNESFCCETYCESIETRFDNASLAYWIHLWRAPEGEQDQLYILANIPGEVAHSPTDATLSNFLETTLQEISATPVPAGFAEKAEEILFTAQNVLLSDLQTYAKAEPRKDCYALVEDKLFIAPSGSPITIPAGSQVEFFPAEKTSGNFDSRALVNFVDANGKRWKSCYPANDKTLHAGYKLLNERAQLYQFPDANISIGDRINVLLGLLSSSDKCAFNYAIEEFQWDVNILSDESTSAGKLIADFKDLVWGDIVDLAFYACFPDITGHEFEQAQEKAAYNPFGRGGFIFKIGEAPHITYVYGFEDEANPGDIHYLFWDKAFCKWSNYYGPTEEITPQIHFLQALFKAAEEVGHDVLDAAGMIPVIGELADVTNGIWYLAEGKNGEAALSFVALIPLAGSTATGGRLILKFQEGVKTITKIIEPQSIYLGKIVCPTGRSGNAACEFQSLAKVAEDMVRRGFSDEKYAKLTNKLLTDSDFFDAFRANPSLVQAWDILELAGRSRLINDLDVIKKLEKLLPNNLNLDEESFIKLFKKHIENGRGAKYTDEDGVQNIVSEATLSAGDLLDALKQLDGSDITNKAKLTVDLCCNTDAKYIGAEWVLRYMKNTNFANIADIEVSVNNGSRIIDVFGSVSPIYRELKSWATFNPNYYPRTIKEFSEDLNIANSLDEMKWIFDKKGNFTSPDYLKTEFIKMLQTTEGRTALGNLPLDKIRLLLDNQEIIEADKIQTIIDYLNIESNFKRIFE